MLQSCLTLLDAASLMRLTRVCKALRPKALQALRRRCMGRAECPLTHAEVAKLLAPARKKAGCTGAMTLSVVTSCVRSAIAAAVADEKALTNTNADTANECVSATA